MKKTLAFVVRIDVSAKGAGDGDAYLTVIAMSTDIIPEEAAHKPTMGLS